MSPRPTATACRRTVAAFGGELWGATVSPSSDHRAEIPFKRLFARNARPSPRIRIHSRLSDPVPDGANHRRGRPMPVASSHCRPHLAHLEPCAGLAGSARGLAGSGKRIAASNQKRQERSSPRPAGAYSLRSRSPRAFCIGVPFLDPRLVNIERHHKDDRIRSRRQEHLGPYARTRAAGRRAEKRLISPCREHRDACPIRLSQGADVTCKRLPDGALLLDCLSGKCFELNQSGNGSLVAARWRTNARRGLRTPGTVSSTCPRRFSAQTYERFAMDLERVRLVQRRS